jgi:hypothetical protein
MSDSAIYHKLRSVRITSKKAASSGVHRPAVLLRLSVRIEIIKHSTDHSLLSIAESTVVSIDMAPTITQRTLNFFILTQVDLIGVAARHPALAAAFRAVIAIKSTLAITQRTIQSV